MKLKMTAQFQEKIDAFMAKVASKDSHETVFLQAVQEVAKPLFLS